INKLDAAASSWQERIKRLEGINLPLDADKRQQLSAKGALAIAILNQTKSKVLAEREHPSLALEITLLGTLESALGLLMQLITDVADSGGEKPWVDAVTAIQDDIAAYAGRLQRHVMSKAVRTYGYRRQRPQLAARTRKSHHVCCAKHQQDCIGFIGILNHDSESRGRYIPS